MVIYFSGNGNSKFVAERISAQLGTAILPLQGDILIAPSKHALENDGKPIVWVFPVYSWGVPPVVATFINECTIKGADLVDHHLVITCGDDAGLTDIQWRKLIELRSWKPLSATSVAMPNTYVLMKGFDTDSQEVVDKKLADAPLQISKAIDNIQSGTVVSDVIKGSFAWIKSKIIYPWFIRHAMSPRPFHYTPACTGCGLCARQCAMNNIIMNHRGAPEWGDKCALCLKCYHRCPTHAVAYGKATINKGQYHCPI